MKKLFGDPAYEQRMRNRGFSDLKDFIRRSGIEGKVSYESCRRVIQNGKHVNIPTLMLILKYLGYSNVEIKAKLEKCGEKEFASFIGNGVCQNLSQSSLTLAARIQKVLEKKPEMETQIESFVIMAEATIHRNNKRGTTV